MKDKNVAGILALFFGALGVHRFYLGQIWLGILYIVFIFTAIPFFVSLLDAILFFSMDKEVFDHKYNQKFLGMRSHSGGRSTGGGDRYYANDRDRERQNERERRREREREREREYHQRKGRQSKGTIPTESNRKKSNPYRERGIQKYKDYDFKGAIQDFKKSLEINSRDKNVHFILSCAYSLMEEVQNSLFHLNKAVKLGFNDFEKISEHDALAYLRTQPEYDRFVDNGYQTTKTIEAPKQVDERQLDDLILGKIQRLGELKDKGFITEVEFEEQKRKLLG